MYVSMYVIFHLKTASVMYGTSQLRESAFPSSVFYQLSNTSISLANAIVCARRRLDGPSIWRKRSSEAAQDAGSGEERAGRKQKPGGARDL